MARKKTTKRKTKSSRKTKKKSSWLDRVPEIPAGPALTAIAWTALVAGVGAGWWLGVPRLEAAVTESAAARNGGVLPVEFSERPPWVDDDLLATLEQMVQREVSADPFARGELVRAYETLDGSGWFEHVDQVRRANALGEARTSGVVVDARFARPFALVRDRDGDHLIDASGRRLPRSFRTTEGPNELVVITGTGFTRPDAGGSWLGADLTAALAIMKLVDMYPWHDQIAHVDLDDGNARIVLVTDLGARIIWGSAPGKEDALEPTAKRKLAFLDKAYETRARIDSGYEGIWRFYEDVYTAE